MILISRQEKPINRALKFLQTQTSQSVKYKRISRKRLSYICLNKYANNWHALKMILSMNSIY